MSEDILSDDILISHIDSDHYRSLLLRGEWGKGGGAPGGHLLLQ